MIFNKHVIRGCLGETVIYSILNLRFDTTLKWDSFRFYTPIATLQDENGKYFNVPGDEVLLERDDSLNKYLLVVVRENSVEAIEVFEGVSYNLILGLEGDIVLYGFIPSDPSLEVVIDYKEVINGTD